jgi:RNA polymerase sigma-70 factor (ECF subfamily)
MASEAKKEMDPAERDLCALMEGYLQGRIEAFDGLHAALAGRIRGYLLSQCRDATLADDLLQDTFMQMHRSRRTYEPGRPVTPWVFAIARHVYLMKRRSTGRRLRFEDTLAAETRSNDIARDDLRALVEKDEVRRALEQVPADQRQALLLHHVEGWSFVEIAARLGIRVNAAKTRAFRGMKKMRGHLK